VFTGNLALSRRIGLKVGSIRTMFNGPIECRMLEFELAGPPPRADAPREDRKDVEDGDRRSGSGETVP
jgi:hypothetical protein